MLEPIVRSIEVPCDRETAFRIFTEDIGSWWPLGRFTQSAMMGSPAQVVVIDLKVGGEIYELDSDGMKVVWGTVDQFNFPSMLSMHFHIPLPKEKVKERSMVVIEFEIVSPLRTKVTLTQTNWEAFGKRGSMLHGGYGLGWANIFDECFATACTRTNKT